MLFDERVARKPVHYPWTEDYIKALWSSFWTPDEFTFQSDKQQFLVNCSEQEQQVIVRTLSAISQIEIAVKKFWARLGDNLPQPEITDLGLVMANTEVIHNKAYEKLLEVLDLRQVFEDNLKLPVINGRVVYLRKYLDRNYTDNRKQFIYALILFTLFVENVSLFSQFYVILWFNRYKNLFKDTAQQIQYTKNEELLHAQTGIKLIQVLREEYPQYFDLELEARIVDETRAAYEAEVEIVKWILGDYAQDNLNIKTLSAYIAHRLNTSLTQIGYSEQFTVRDELEKFRWMEEDTLGSTLTDFFAKKPVEYTKHNKAYEIGDLF